MKKEKVSLAIMAPSMNLCNYLFGIHRGFFLEEGLEVEVIFRPGRRNTDAVMSGEADFGAANECVIKEALQGPTDLKILLQVLKDPLHDLIVTPEIETLQDLKGKRIATPAEGSTPLVQTKMFFQNNGLIPDRDVILVPQAHGQTMKDRIRQFEQGEYTGLIAAPPTPSLLHKKGFKSLTASQKGQGTVSDIVNASSFPLAFSHFGGLTTADSPNDPICGVPRRDERRLRSRTRRWSGSYTLLRFVIGSSLTRV